MIYSFDHTIPKNTAAASADGLMRAADRAMYWIKEHGKNGISVFTV